MLYDVAKAKTNAEPRADFVWAESDCSDIVAFKNASEHSPALYLLWAINGAFTFSGANTT